VQAGKFPENGNSTTSFQFSVSFPKGGRHAVVPLLRRAGSAFRAGLASAASF